MHYSEGYSKGLAMPGVLNLAYDVTKRQKPMKALVRETNYYMQFMHYNNNNYYNFLIIIAGT